MSQMNTSILKSNEDFFDLELQRASLRTEINYRISRKGRVLIFNYFEFDKLSGRNGSDKDVEALKEMFQFLSFDQVFVYENLTVFETKDILLEEHLFDHSENDCLIICILSHGDSEGFHCRNGVIPYSFLWKSFSGDRCPSLISKPKLIFLQCCRGKNYDKGGLVHDSPADEQYIRLPITADIFVFYATFLDYYAIRNPKNGSWFIQELAKTVRKYASEHDLLTLATLTCKAIAYEHETFVVDNIFAHKKKQMPTVMSTLTKRLFFSIDC